MATVASVRDKAFLISEFENPKTGSTSWRVSGSLRGKRIRENFASRQAAEARRLELDSERLGQRSAEVLRATWLTTDQLKTAEWVFHRTPEPDEVKRAFEFWERRGRELERAHGHAATLSVDDAFTKFAAWLETSPGRPATKKNLFNRVRMFVGALGRMPLAEVDADVIEDWLGKRKVGQTTRINDRLAISRWLAWCVARPQRFLATNPAAVVKLDRPESGAPEIYTLREVARLLVAAKRFRDGRFLPYVALQLFGGLRPTEASRLSFDQFKDGELRIEGKQAKTGDARTVKVDPVLAAWLALGPREGLVGDPMVSRKLWSQFRANAGLSRWIPDGLRHTAVSHFFRRCGSYGLTAEWAGNSEAVIREHYQGRTTAAESADYWTMFPDRQERKQARAQLADVIELTAEPKRKQATA